MKHARLTLLQDATNRTNGQRNAPSTAATGNSSRLIWAGAAAATAGLMAAPSPVQATPSFTAPAGLSPGSDYLVLFLTTKTTNGTSSSIAVYNTFVNADAAAENPALPSTTWSAIASTESVSAKSNIACLPGCGNLPVYAVDGTQIATSLDAIFATGNPYAQNGVLEEAPLFDTGAAAGGTTVWTGTAADGSIAGGNALGDSGPIVGFNVGNAYSFFVSNVGIDTAQHPLYAISGELTVPQAPTPAPEPASASLLASAVGAMALAAGRRRRAPGARPGR